MAQAVAAQQAANETLAEQKLRINSASQRGDQLTEQQTALEAEFHSTTEQEVTVTRSLNVARERLDKLQAGLAHAEARMSDNIRRIDELDSARGQRNRDCLAAQVELARSEQQLDHLRGQLSRYEQDRQDRQRTIAESNEHLAECVQRREQTEQNILAAESELAELFLRHETLTAQAASLVQQREQFRTERTEHAQVAQRHRAKIHKLEQELHAQDLVAGEIRHERATLESRFAKITASSLPSSPTSPRPRNNTSAKRSKPKSPICAAN